jgi:hypothetical protein
MSSLGGITEISRASGRYSGPNRSRFEGGCPLHRNGGWASRFGHWLSDHGSLANPSPNYFRKDKCITKAEHQITDQCFSEIIDWR